MWTIYEVRNTLLVSKDCAKELLKDEDTCADFGSEDVSDFWNKSDGRLIFNPDRITTNTWTFCLTNL